jgi:putative addiction module antidote
MATLKLRRIGNSVGVVLPKEILARLKLGAGDEVFVSDAPHGVTLSTLNPEAQRQVEIGREFMREYREVFKALAE